MAHSGHSDELCDVCGIVDDFPAVVGMDLNSLEKNMSDILSHLTRKANSRGAVVTVSWHHKNPVTGGPVYIQDDRGDVLHSVKRLLPGGDHYHRFLSDLDTVASWARSLLDSQGRAIPIILRPFHEAGGDWFWWGLGNSAYNNASDVVRLYQTTVKYLRDEKRVHNLLYAFSPNCAYDWNANALYPGDSYVDIVGVDCYRSQSRDLAAMTTAVQGAVSHARRAGKVAAWTEFGLSSGLGTHTSFFTHDILQTELSSPTLMGVAYMMTWTNRCGPEGTCSVYAPYPGHPAATDFRRFYLDSRTMFLSDLKRYASWYFN